MSAATVATETYDPHRALSAAEEQSVARFADAISDATTVAVAFSGGVDSSVALALAVRTKGTHNVVAVLGVSPSLATSERDQAQRVATSMGVRLVEVLTQEMKDPRYVANDADRCYFCKHELYSRSMLEAVADTGADMLLNGDTADDALTTDRAGRRAAVELGVVSPLVDAGIGKAAVRSIARNLGLPVWDKPSSPCLASRIPRSVPVTIGRLQGVERAEAGLRALGLRELRVRHREGTGLVQLGPDEEKAAQDATVRAGIEDAVRDAGFERAEISTQTLRRA